MIVSQSRCIFASVHGKYVYSTLALGKEREIVKEETCICICIARETTCSLVKVSASDVTEIVPGKREFPVILVYTMPFMYMYMYLCKRN